MKQLIIDVETAPHNAWVWGLWKQTVSLPMLAESGYLLCWAAKWHGEEAVMFRSLQDGRAMMLGDVWTLLNEADSVITYFGTGFDMPVLNAEFLQEGMPPPSPAKQIDLKKIVAKKFRLPSNKLQYVSDNLLGLGGKESTGGFDTWLGCMSGDEAAWARMREYNERDVVVTEEVYDRLLPWIDNHPNRNLFRDSETDIEGCPNCGSVNLVKEGFAYTAMGKFQRFSCKNCGRWSRATKRLDGVQIVGAR